MCVIMCACVWVCVCVCENECVCVRQLLTADLFRQRARTGHSWLPPPRVLIGGYLAVPKAYMFGGGQKVTERELVWGVTELLAAAQNVPESCRWRSCKCLYVCVWCVCVCVCASNSGECMHVYACVCVCVRARECASAYI